jgi:hypothetical protein
MTPDLTRVLAWELGGARDHGGASRRPDPCVWTIRILPA